MIETTNLTRRYGDLVAVDGLSLSVPEGQRCALLGPNGAGKSTTLLMLTTLLKPTSGSASVNGFDVVRQPGQVRRSIGVVFQEPSSDDTLTGYENLKLHGMLYGMPSDLRERRIVELLELVELTSRKDDVVKHYSGGMRRRLEIARGLMHHPKVLFLDEPTLGLDPQSRENLWRHVDELAKEHRITLILTTHYMDEAERLCDRIAIMDAGKIVASDTPDQLKKVIGGDVVTIKAPAAIAAQLEKLAYVTRVEVRDGMLAITTTDARRNLPELLKIAGDVESVEVHSPTLNDVFLHFTGRDLRADSPEGGWAERSMQYRSRTK